MLIHQAVPPSTISSIVTNNPNPTDPASISSSSTPATKSTSRAWIAGPVIGGLAAIAIIVGLAFWVWMLKRRAKTQGVIPVPNDEKKEEHNGTLQPGANGVPTTSELESGAIGGHNGRAELYSAR